MRFGARLRQYRVMAGLTQAELAALAGTTQDYVSDLERGKHFPNVKLLVRLAGGLGVNSRDLVQAAVMDV